MSKSKEAVKTIAAILRSYFSEELGDGRPDLDIADELIKAFKDAGGVFLSDDQSLPEIRRVIFGSKADTRDQHIAQQDMLDANFRRVRI